MIVVVQRAVQDGCATDKIERVVGPFDDPELQAEWWIDAQCLLGKSPPPSEAFEIHEVEAP